MAACKFAWRPGVLITADPVREKVLYNFRCCHELPPAPAGAADPYFPRTPPPPPCPSWLQRSLKGMVGQSSGYIESLPAPVRTRIDYLKELDGERAELFERYRWVLRCR